MLNKRWYGITLVELMAVLLILSILASVGGVAYTKYMVKSRFTEVFTTINSYKSDLAVAYVDNDAFPATFNGIASNSAGTISSGVLIAAFYKIATDTQSAYLSFFTANLGVTGYVQPNNSGVGGKYSKITIVAVAGAAGQLRMYCGQWDGTDEDVPLSYLPATCQDTSLSSLVT